MKNLKLKLFISLGLTLPQFFVSAGLTVPPRPGGVAKYVGNTPEATIVNYVNIVLGVVGMLTIAYLIYGGVIYITAGGNEESAESGKKTIRNAIVGLIIILFSYVIVSVIITSLNK